LKYCVYDENLRLMMYDDVGGRKEVQNCHIDEAQKTLGVMLEPDDNNKSQIIRMRQYQANLVTE